MDLETFLNSTMSNGSSTIVHLEGLRHVSTWITIVTAVFLSPIIILGILGNLFSLLVWVKGRRRKTSTARFLSALAIADILVLSTSALDFWIAYVLHVDVRAHSRFLCKTFYYMSFTGPSVSAWILVAVTVERAFSVWLPHRVSVVCRPLTASIVIGSTVLGLCLIYLPIIVGVDVITIFTNVMSWTECNILSTSAYNKYLSAWLYLDLCLFFIAPFFVMTTCNIFILAKVVCLSNKRRATLHARGQASSSTGGKAKKMLKTVTRRIVILSVTYCICNAPLTVFNVLLLTPSFSHVIDPRHVQSFRIPFHLLMYLNNGVNFLLYCVIGSGFRKDLVGIFRPGSRTSTTR